MARKNEPIVLRLNLLHPQGAAEKTTIRFLRWLLSVGRYIVVLVEALVLVAFVSRFKFDSDLENLKENIDAQIPYIESLKNDENLIRQTQLQLSYIADKRLNYPNYADILKRISAQTPKNIKLTYITIEKNDAKATIKLTGTSSTTEDISSFVLGLKTDKLIGEVNLVSVGLDQGQITFSINASTPAKFQKGDNL